MATAAVRVTVRGLVTGVGFRYSARREAASFPTLRGYVRNADSRTVECVLQGQPEHVQHMLDWLQHGPPSARVTDCSVTRIPACTDLDLFQITF